MKTIVISAVFLCCLTLATATQYSCKAQPVQYPPFKNMENECIVLMKNQVQKELNAALTYLAMAAHFSEDQVNRPGFAKMFFESANEEREHAIKFIEYLLMRGELENDIKDLISDPYPAKALTWVSGLAALENALRLEVNVTKSINEIIKKCENPNEGENDYHLVDYLTGEFLEEQYKGQRELAGQISILGKMTKSLGDLGEYMFDKKLLDGELPALG